MNLDHMLAQLRGTLPSVVLQPDCLPEDWPTCAQRRCRRPAAIKKNGEPAKSCQACLDRRAASCRRRRAALAAEGGCRRCAYCKRLEGDFHGRSRGDRPVPARRAPRLGAAQSPAARRRRHRTDGEPAGKVRPVGRVRVRARRGGGARPPAQKGARWLPPRRRPVSLHQAKCLVCPENDASNRNLTMISGLDFRTAGAGLARSRAAAEPGLGGGTGNSPYSVSALHDRQSNRPPSFAPYASPSPRGHPCPSPCPSGGLGVMVWG